MVRKISGTRSEPLFSLDLHDRDNPVDAAAIKLETQQDPDAKPVKSLPK